MPMKFYAGPIGEDLVEIDVAYLDGYAVGDRLLEGVMFECRIDPTTGPDWNITVNVCPQHAEYFTALNHEMWLTKMTDYANDKYVDSFLANVEGTEDAYLEEDDV